MVAILFLLMSAVAFAGENRDAAIDDAMPGLLQTYQHIHSNPELSHFEERTAVYVAGELRKLGFEVTEGIGKYEFNPKLKCHGVMAVLKNGPGKTVLLRTELDALPIVEQTGVPYSSKVTVKNEQNQDVGVMHACGHDVHMTSALGAAKILVQSKAAWSGTLMVVGQPAEETVDGAVAMVRDNLYERFPRPDYVLALHCDANIEVGKVGVCPGYVAAAADALEVTMRGIGGHAARPDQTKDPIVMSAEFILQLQTIVSRERSPFDPAVVTVSMINAGTKVNVIPDEVTMRMSVRTYGEEVRKKTLESVHRIAKAVALSAGVPEDRYPIVKAMTTDKTDATYNDPALTEKALSILQKELGAENAVASDRATGSEDVGVFALNKQIPLCYFKLGTVNPNAPAAKPGVPRGPSLHNCTFAPLPGPTIRTGVRSLSALVLNLLAK